ncbi:MAG: dihydroorotate dehydrogenase electron transfer subunit [Anaerolineae bacterium]|nr:dihydroorotate dehydrogenase electron transfer subunit [Anaerolineae bacterium]
MHQTFTITDVHEENYRTKTFVFDAPLAGAYPGQFVMAWLPEVGEKPFSIAGNDPLALTIVNVGPVSAALHRLAAGKRVWIRGPFGQGFEIQGERLLLAGGGYGVAPLRYLAQTARAAGCEVEVCIGARTAADVLLVLAFERLGCAVRVVTEDGSLGERGLVTQAVASAIQIARPDCVYACGPAPMLKALAVQCREHALPHQLSWEAHMRCGLGICGDCELDPETGLAAHVPPGWRVCQDGPVMRYGMGSRE